MQELNQANLPNAANILDNLKTVDFDNGRKYSLTWQSGYAGIAWNKERLPKGLKSVDDLWKPELKGKVEVLSEMRDTLGLIMLNQASTSPARSPPTSSATPSTCSRSSSPTARSAR